MTDDTTDPTAESVPESDGRQGTDEEGAPKATAVEEWMADLIRVADQTGRNSKDIIIGVPPQHPQHFPRTRPPHD